MRVECERPTCQKPYYREWEGTVPWFLIAAAVLVVHVRHGNCSLRVTVGGETHVERPGGVSSQGLGGK